MYKYMDEDVDENQPENKYQFRYIQNSKIRNSKNRNLNFVFFNLKGRQVRRHLFSYLFLFLLSFSLVTLNALAKENKKEQANGKAKLESTNQKAQSMLSNEECNDLKIENENYIEKIKLKTELLANNQKALEDLKSKNESDLIKKINSNILLITEEIRELNLELQIKKAPLLTKCNNMNKENKANEKQ